MLFRYRLVVMRRSAWQSSSFLVQIWEQGKTIGVKLSARCRSRKFPFDSRAGGLIPGMVTVNYLTVAFGTTSDIIPCIKIVALSAVCVILSIELEASLEGAI
jgi:hypothetical protein